MNNMTVCRNLVAVREPGRYSGVCSAAGVGRLYRSCSRNFLSHIIVSRSLLFRKWRFVLLSCLWWPGNEVFQ